MKNDLPPHPDLFSHGAEASERFWSCLIQTFNWGTFSGVHRFPMARRGHLFVGPSGAGKSTALDAHAALTTPPLWLNFNVAAREAERGGVDRNAVSYVRGAWAEQTADSGEVAAQYLRTGTTWSVIAETFRNGRGDVVTLVQLLYIRGSSNAASDLKKLYLVLKREIDVHEFKVFAESDFDVRKLKAIFNDAWIGDKFSGYQERFRGLLGIESEAALKLLHKTQSAKNLGDLNAFLRDFMLDQPETFEIANDLVKEFGDLNDAHQSLVEAGHQIDTLEPARVENEELSRGRATSLGLDNLREAIDPYREQTKAKLLADAVKALTLQIEGAQGDIVGLKSQSAAELLKLNEMRSRRAGLGGALIADLEQQRTDAQAQREARVLKRQRAEAASQAMGWTLPATASAMVGLVDQAKAALLADAATSSDLAEQRFKLRRSLDDKAAEFTRLRDEIAAMERQPSNIPQAMLRLRDSLCEATAVPAAKLPFAGELMQVKAAEAAQWQGAAERVLRGFALSLVVDERWYERVARWVNDTHLGMRLVFLRALPQRVGNVAPGPDSLARKIDVAPGDLATWVSEELKGRFDYECIADPAAFRAVSRAAVSPQGLIKHNSTRHEKDDRSALGDRRLWVLGFDNAAKLQLFRADAQQVAGTIAELQLRLGSLDESEAQQKTNMRHCQTLVGFAWDDIDVAAMVRKIDELTQRIQAEQAARPDLKALDADIARQAKVHEYAADKVHHQQADIDQWSKARLGHEGRQERLDERLLAMTLPLPLIDGIAQRFADTGKTLALDNLSELTLIVERTLGNERAALQSAIDALKATIERRLADFVRTWPAESAGLDARIESIDDFMAKLHRLRADRLPEFRARFMDLLTRQSDQNLTRLSHQLETERNAIRERLETVNDSLGGAQFNPGTYLTIESTDKMLEPVRAFRAELKAAHTGSLSSDPALAEQRFLALKVLVKRLASQDAADQRWRSLVLDVRQHIDFIARERDGAGVEVEVYRSGAGKSGGQRQKLAATCLAAALRYQLGGVDGAFPIYSTVVLDEAFDKADPKFTALAMNIFVEFGFQMIVATPMRSVMALEPFIGGATYVSIKDRKHSQARQIEYDEAQSRLQLSGDEVSGDEKQDRASAVA